MIIISFLLLLSNFPAVFNGFLLLPKTYIKFVRSLSVSLFLAHFKLLDNSFQLNKSTEITDLVNLEIDVNVTRLTLLFSFKTKLKRTKTNHDRLLYWLTRAA